MTVPGLSSYSVPQVERRRLIVLLVAALAVARGAQLPQFANLRDAIALKAWRDERKARREERRRRERETPLNTPALEKKMVDLVSFQRLLSP